MKNINTFLLISFFLLNQFSWAQIRQYDKLPAKEKIVVSNNNSDLKIQESLTVLVHFPKSVFSEEQINQLLDANNHLLEISAQSIIQKKDCNEGAIKNKSLSDCWVKTGGSNPISVLAQNYIYLNDNNPEYFTIQATVTYPNLAPKTALISVFLEGQFLQSIKSGTWDITCRTMCDFQIPMNRWSEFVFQPNAGSRGFALRGIAGTSSICSLPKKTDTVEFWINKN